jgi:hypothetical protein
MRDGRAWSDIVFPVSLAILLVGLAFLSMGLHVTPIMVEAAIFASS